MEFIFYFLLITCKIIYSEAVSGPDTLALFSILDCPEEFQNHCENARINAIRMRWAHSITIPTYKLCTIDVENSYQYVTDIILDVINFEATNYCGKCFDRTENITLSLSNAHGIIFTYVPFEMARYIASLLLVKLVDVVLISVTTQAMYPSPLIDENDFIFGYESSLEIGVQRKSINSFFEHYGMTYSAVLYLKENEQDSNTIKKPCHEREETAFCFYLGLDKLDKKHCIKEKLVDPKSDQELNYTMYFIKQDPHLRVLVLYGFGASGAEFVRNRDFVYKHHQNQNPGEHHQNQNPGDFYMLPFEKSLTNSTIPSEHIDKNRLTAHGGWISVMILKNVPGEHALNEFFKYAYHIDWHLVYKELAFSALSSTGILAQYLTKYESLLKKYLKDWKTGDELTYQKWEQIDENVRKNHCDTNSKS